MFLIYFTSNLQFYRNSIEMEADFEQNPG